MIISRNKEFSKKDKKSEEIKGAAMLTGGVLAPMAGHVIGDKVTRKSGKYLMNSDITAKDKDQVKRKLLQKAKKQGIKVIDVPEFGNSAYVGSKAGSKIRNTVAAGLKVLRKYGHGDDARKISKQLGDSAEWQLGSRKLWDNIGKDRVIMGRGKLSEVDVLSHELGHAQYMRPGRSKSIVGKAAHKLDAVSKVATGKGGQVLSFAHGFRSGVKNERNKQKGKKSNTWDKVKSVAIPAALAAPMLIAEGKASLNGLKSMKKAGASKELMKQSAKRLGAAWGTYAGQASKSVVSGGAGDIAGRGYAKLTKKKDE